MKKFEKKVAVYTLENDFAVEVERSGETVEDIILANVEEYIEYFFERYGDK